MKTALILVVAIIAVAAAGCGSSDSSSATSPSPGPTTTAASPTSGQPSYLRRFQTINNRFEQSPQIAGLSEAFAIATTHPEELAHAEAPLRGYLHRIDSYIAELRGVDFPTCARRFQEEIIKFESEGRADVAQIVPLLRAGEVARVLAYVKRAGPELSAKLGQVETKERSIEDGGNDGC